MMGYPEFVGIMEENPYYPVLIKDYPKLFDFEPTAAGLTYFQRLRKEWSEGDLSDRECLYLGMLHLAYATSMKSARECKEWQAYMFLLGVRPDLEGQGIKTTLKQMGCIRDNPAYDPKLYKRHILWKAGVFAAANKVQSQDSKMPQNKPAPNRPYGRQV